MTRRPYSDSTPEDLLREVLAKWDADILDAPGDPEVWGEDGLIARIRTYLDESSDSPVVRSSQR
jgi:hypothetical protein